MKHTVFSTQSNCWIFWKKNILRILFNILKIWHNFIWAKEKKHSSMLSPCALRTVFIGHLFIGCLLSHIFWKIMMGEYFLLNKKFHIELKKTASRDGVRICHFENAHYQFHLHILSGIFHKKLLTLLHLLHSTHIPI